MQVEASEINLRDLESTVGTFSPSFCIAAIELQVARLERGVTEIQMRRPHPDRGPGREAFRAALLGDEGIVASCEELARPEKWTCDACHTRPISRASS